MEFYPNGRDINMVDPIWILRKPAGKKGDFLSFGICRGNLWFAVRYQ